MDFSFSHVLFLAAGLLIGTALARLDIWRKR